MMYGLVQQVGKGGESWNPHFTRPFNDWELDEVENMLRRLCGEECYCMRRMG